MPSYEFECDTCHRRFTIERLMSDRATSPACPHCQSKATHQVLSAFYAKTIKKS